jgi:hypothetical protein
MPGSFLKHLNNPAQHYVLEHSCLVHARFVLGACSNLCSLCVPPYVPVHPCCSPLSPCNLARPLACIASNLQCSRALKVEHSTCDDDDDDILHQMRHGRQDNHATNHVRCTKTRKAGQSRRHIEAKQSETITCAFTRVIVLLLTPINCVSFHSRSLPDGESSVPALFGLISTQISLPVVFCRLIMQI